MLCQYCFRIFTYDINLHIFGPKTPNCQQHSKVLESHFLLKKNRDFYIKGISVASGNKILSFTPKE